MPKKTISIGDRLLLALPCFTSVNSGVWEGNWKELGESCQKRRLLATILWYQGEVVIIYHANHAIVSLSQKISDENYNFPQLKSSEILILPSQVFLLPKLNPNFPCEIHLFPPSPTDQARPETSHRGAKMPPTCRTAGVPQFSFMDLTSKNGDSYGFEVTTRGCWRFIGVLKHKSGILLLQCISPVNAEVKDYYCMRTSNTCDDQIHEPICNMI